MSDDFQGRGGSPWGTPPGGGNGSGKGPTPPDIDAIIRDIQNKIFCVFFTHFSQYLVSLYQILSAKIRYIF